jgi:hypothetical protein
MKPPTARIPSELFEVMVKVWCAWASRSGYPWVMASLGVWHPPSALHDEVYG